MLLKARRGLNDEVDIDINSISKIHIMGICGTAMAGLAGLLQQKGYALSGSDKSFYPPISEELKKMALPVFQGYKANHIRSDLDLVIVGNVISRNNPEALGLLKSSIPYVHLPSALNAFIIQKKKTLMVCGTHGKTTASCLSAWVLDRHLLSPGFMIGGVSENFNSGFRLMDSNWFVIEGDEYDTAFFEKTAKFLHYPADHIILNNIEFDHADIYTGLPDIERAFCLLLEKHSSSKVIAGVDSPVVKKLINKVKTDVVSYGTSDADWTLIKRKTLIGGGQVLSIKNRKSRKTEEVFTPLSGQYNALNVLAVWTFSSSLGLCEQKTKQALASFKGVRRRFQVLGDFSGKTLVEDFAHHPTAVASVLKAAREVYPKRNIIAVFEPRSNTSRKKLFERDYENSFLLADKVFCLSPYDHKEKDDSFSSQQVVENLNQKGIPSFCSNDVKSLSQKIVKKSQKKDVIIVMSNGDFGNLCSLLKQEL